MGYVVKLPKAAVFGAANGVIFMTFFGALWSAIGIISLAAYSFRYCDINVANRSYFANWEST